MGSNSACNHTSAICLITSTITNRIGRHEVVLPINHNYNKIYYISGFVLIKHNTSVFLLAVKKSHLSARVRWRVLSDYRHDAYCPITLSISAEIRTVDSQSDLRILL